VAMEAKLASLTSGIQKQAGTNSSRRLEAAISQMKALERQAAIVQSPVVQRSVSSQSSGSKRSYGAPHSEDGLESMRQRLSDMERRARDRARLQSLQQQQQRQDDDPTDNRPGMAQSVEMKAAKQAMLSALCDNGASLKELEVAVSGLKHVVDEADAGDPGLAEATVMLAAARTRMRRLQGYQ